MHRCRLAAAFVGIGAWYAARGLVAVAICVLFAVPFAVLLVGDVLSGERAALGRRSDGPPAPPRQPVSCPVYAVPAAA